MPDVEATKKQEVPSWLLENIAELSKHVRTLHAVYVGFLIYCASTVLTTPDRKIILDEQAHLPIVNLDVPFSGFVLVVPIVAVFVFIDFQIHLQVLKGVINKARTDYAPIERGRLYPWIGNLAEEPELGLLGAIERLIVNISLWWLMPVVLILITFFTFKKHSTALSALEWAISFIGMCLVLWLWHRYEYAQVEQQQSQASSSRIKKWINALIDNWKKVLFGAILFLIHLILLLMIPEENKIRSGWFRADLKNEILVKPQSEDLEGYWANLQGVHLYGANLYGADLKRADLREAQLQQAVLQRARLVEAYLSGANMKGAILSEAKLQLAHLDATDLTQANLNCANLAGADFDKANLSGAYLVGADLSAAQNLSVDQLLYVASLYKAKLDKELQDKICKARPELLNEPASEDMILNQFPSQVKKNPITKFQDLSPKQERPINVRVIPLLDYNALVLVKAGSNSHLLWERFIYTKVEIYDSEHRIINSQEYLDREELTNPIIVPCYKDSLPTTKCD